MAPSFCAGRSGASEQNDETAHAALLGAGPRRLKGALSEAADEQAAARAARASGAPKSYRFEPRVIQVKQGGKVTWTNHDDFPHTVQILAGADAATHDLCIGKSVTISFDRAGTVYYRCSLHPAQMKGEVVVTP